jgi:heparosan-N-sulfate-glucuronate 5-epimerase
VSPLTGGAVRRRMRAVRVFSTAMWFPQEVGSRFRIDEVNGYYVDLREAAKAPEWPPPWLQQRKLYVGICQWGLGSFERYLAGDGHEWLDAAVAAGDHLLDRQEKCGRFDGGWVHHFAYPNTYHLPPPWLSGIAQGQAASLLVRLHLATGDTRYAVGARNALLSLSVPTDEGGLLAPFDGGGFPEEFPTDPPSLILNGGIYALLGQYDVAVGLDDAGARERFAEGIDTLARNLDRWDTGYWSRYDLHPHRIAHVASPWYHTLHIAQLKVLDRLTDRPEFGDVTRRFEAYASSRAKSTRAVVQKVLFRFLVPRRGTRIRRP